MGCFKGISKNWKVLESYRHFQLRPLSGKHDGIHLLAAPAMSFATSFSDLYDRGTITGIHLQKSIRRVNTVASLTAGSGLSFNFEYFFSIRTFRFLQHHHHTDYVHQVLPQETYCWWYPCSIRQRWGNQGINSGGETIPGYARQCCSGQCSARLDDSPS